jgi:alkylation response protein AidB-like acyl-CoA dehydrogenase
VRFALTDDQEELAAAVRKLLAAEAGEPFLRAAVDDPGLRTGPVWDRLVELGVFTALLPEARGGLGLGGVEAALIAEEIGRAALPGPVVETALVVPLLLGEAPDGAGVVAVRQGSAGGVPDAELADAVLLPDGDAGVLAAPRGDLQLVALPQVDASRTWWTIGGTVTGRVVAPGADAVAALADIGAVLTAAQLVGAGQAVLDQAVAYATQRAQFGRAIGSYQAVKHQLADVVVALAFARPLVLRAAAALDGEVPTRSRDASAAKAAAARAADRAARVALQVHGAIGYTQELGLQLWLTRIWSLLPQWGAAAAHRRQVLAALRGGRRPERYP